MNPHAGTGSSADRAATAPGGGRAEPGAGTVAVSSVAPSVLGPPESRGQTQIADRVLERIAARAVTETAQVGGAAPRLLGIPLGRDTAHTAARVTAHVDGHLAIVKVTLSVPYPAPIRQVTRRVREHVTTRVGELTGLDVRQVDIDIASLPSPEQQPRRVL
ncbi:Asp23/Gls24 family envelope stress response protein [Actinomadura miaoliensis]|uniref:Asp23/Gls24 family envelope stress response protein n=1 Tax=Actinomadura miaoliensis TaxID=430685 RepID=A0ABP7W0C9_9ACTN